MAVQRSNNFTLIVNANEADAKLAFAHSQEASLSFSNALVEATLGVSNGWTEFVSGKRTTSISFSGLQDYGTITNRYNVDDLAEFLLDENIIYFQVGDNTSYQSGKGYISEITLEGSTDNTATYSGVLSVVGELQEVVEETLEKLQDSDGVDILDDAGQPIYAKILR